MGGSRGLKATVGTSAGPISLPGQEVEVARVTGPALHGPAPQGAQRHWPADRWRYGAQVMGQQAASGRTGSTQRIGCLRAQTPKDA